MLLKTGLQRIGNLLFANQSQASFGRSIWAFHKKLCYSSLFLQSSLKNVGKKCHQEQWSMFLLVGINVFKQQMLFKS